MGERVWGKLEERGKKKIQIKKKKKKNDPGNIREPLHKFDICNIHFSPKESITIKGSSRLHMK